MPRALLEALEARVPRAALVQRAPLVPLASEARQDGVKTARTAPQVQLEVDIRAPQESLVRPAILVRLVALEQPV